MSIQFKKKYYYVQRCPNCKSRVTGRYILKRKWHNQIDMDYMELNSLKNGELIKFLDDDFINNCYCEDCGCEWHYDVVGRLISKDRFIEECQVRGTKERLKDCESEEQTLENATWQG